MLRDSGTFREDYADSQWFDRHKTIGGEKMRYEKKVKQAIVSYVWNYFQPMHEHIGEEKAIDIRTLAQDTADNVSQIPVVDKRHKWFKKDFTNYVSHIIHEYLMKKKSKRYLRGLMCETRSGKGIQRRGFYYFVQSTFERERIYHNRLGEIKAQTIATQQRDNDAKQHIYELLPDNRQRKFIGDQR